MSSIFEEIKKEIDALDVAATKTNTGNIIYVADGVARVNGLSKVMFNEMISFSDGTIGLAMNLEEEEVGVILLGDYSKLKEGDEAQTTGKLLSVPVGKELLGRVVDMLGNPLDGKGPIPAKEYYPVEKIAPGIIKRKSVDQPVQTGITAIDAMIPIGRGQRELIIGDRQTGKTTIAIDTILNQAKINSEGLASGDSNFRPVYSIYVAIGQKNSNIARIIKILEDANALQYTIIVAAAASENAASQYLAPFAGTAMGEWFMQNGQDALIIYDDLTKQAAAYRQISLILKRPAGREAYPGDIFYLHSRLLERSARLSEENGNGSLTALPIIETQAGDVAAYIPTNVISITDGQIFLDTDLFNQGVRPAISVGISVSRVGSSAQIKAVKKVGGGVKLALAQYREMSAFAQFGSDLDERTKATLDRGARLVEIFKQPIHAPKSVAIQVVLLWAAQNGAFDKIEVENCVAAVKDIENFFETRKKSLLDTIAAEKQLNEKIEADIKAAVEEWASTQHSQEVKK